MKHIISVSVILVLLMLAFSVAAQDDTNLASKRSNIGVGFNLGLQKPYCDVLHTGVGLAGEFMMRFLVGDYLDVSVGLGYGTLNDGFSYNTFVTDMITGDVKANIHLTRPGKTNPYVSMGIGFNNFSYTRNKPWAIGSEEFEDERFTDGIFIFGAGTDFMLTPQIALNTLIDYRFSMGDALDGAEVGKHKDGYLNARVGITYYLSPRGQKPAQTEDELLALQRSEYGSAMSGATGSNNRFDMFEAKLDKMEAADANLSMEQYVRLKSRVDELNQLVTIKEDELDELKSTLDFKEQRIADLQSALQTSEASGAGSAPLSRDFSYHYEQSLRKFYARDYRGAIALFSSLLREYPTHTLASNCQYWLGECYFGSRDYKSAADAFTAVFNYAESTKRDDATLMLGRCYYSLNERGKAREYFQAVIDQHQGSEYVEKARQWLRRL